MPSSRPNVIPTVIHLLRQLRPRSILDVGVGFGKWGHLFREYTDIQAAEQDPARYQRDHWQVRIDGIEGHAAYLTPMHRFLYDEIHVGNAGDLVKSLANYDLIFLGDVLEHFEKPAGFQLLADAYAKAGRAVIVSTPRFETEQGDLCGNDLERHRSLWSETDFGRWPGAIVTTVDEATLLAVLAKPGGPKLDCCPPRATRPQDRQRLLLAVEELRASVPNGSRYILVDEEQVRSLLPPELQGGWPFQQKEGRYWGPPADDPSAIEELERLRAAGAEFVVFVWSTFWWLNHYTGFAAHLRERYRVVRETEAILVFGLGNLAQPENSRHSSLGSGSQKT